MASKEETLKAMRVWIIWGAIIFALGFLEKGKFDEKLWGIPLVAIVPLTVSAMLLLGRWFNGRSRAYGSLSMWYVRIPILALFISISLGYIFQEKDSDKAIVAGVAAGAAVIGEEEAGVGGLAVAEGAADVGSGAVDILDDLDGAGKAIVFIVALALVALSAFIPNFWVFSCALLLSFAFVVYLRQEKARTQSDFSSLASIFRKM
jgi:hypothetical protein